MKNIIISSFICYLFTSCDPCLSSRSCADTFDFKIIDKSTGQDLVFGPAPIYDKDSVYLTTKLQGYGGPMSYPTNGKFTSSLLIPVDTFFYALM